MELATLFYSYSHKDSSLRADLDKHLALLKRQGYLSTWFDGQINPGTEWKTAIKRELESANIVLLLVSADFLASEFCWSVEIERTMKRHDAGGVVVVPVILRPCDWESAPFGRLQALPENGQAVTQWKTHDEAWLSVVKGLRQVLGSINGSAREFREQPRERWVLSIEAELDYLESSQLSSIAELLRDISGDVKLKINKITKGSVRIQIDISPEGAERLRNAIDAGKLINIIGFKVLGLFNFASEDTGPDSVPGGADYSSLLIADMVKQDLQVEAGGNIAGNFNVESIQGGRITPFEFEEENSAKRASVSARILFLSVNTEGASTLRLDQEVREIDRGLHRARNRFELRHQIVSRSVDLQQALMRHRPQILHFAGYGYTDGIHLEDEAGEMHKVEAGAIARLISVFSNYIRCVVLNGCYSQEQAEAIAKNVDCVVGISAQIGNHAGIHFAAAFYRALAFGRSVETAFELGRAQLELENLGAVITPQLIARADPGEIVFVEGNQ